MKKTLQISVGLALSFLPLTSVHAADYDFYTAARGTYSWMRNDATLYLADPNAMKGNDNVFGAALAAGIRSPIPYGALRGEIEFNYRAPVKRTTIDTAATIDDSLKLYTRSFMFNVYYDIPTQTPITPYITAGAGISSLRLNHTYIDTYSVTSTSKNFAWNIGAGAAYEVNKHISVDLGYRYSDNGSAKATEGLEVLKVKAAAHEALLGLRYHF